MDCRLEKGKSLGVITQNIDGLHEDLGSEHIDEIHGTESLLLHQLWEKIRNHMLWNTN